MFGVATVAEIQKEKVDPLVFVQIMHQCHNQQMSLKMGIKKYGNGAIEAQKKELRQMHMRDSFIPMHKSSLTAEERRRLCEAVNLIKLKSSGELKGCTCANGSYQRNYISKEEAASPTVSMEAVIITVVMEAKERRYVITCDIPNAFIQTKVEDKSERVILVLRGLAADLLAEMFPEVYKDYIKVERGQSVLYLECTTAIYGTLKAALLFYKAFKQNMEAKGFEINPYDRCTAKK